MKIRVIHGIHSPEGDNNMARFAPHLQRVMPHAEVLLFQYGFMGFWQARWRNDGVARGLAEASKHWRNINEPEVWVTHSNGAAVAYLAVEKYGAMPDMIVNFNPALDRWLTAPVQRVETIHSDEDRWVQLSQWLPFHIWGDQGKVGYRGSLGNTINHNASHFGAGMAYDSHTGAFDAKRAPRWAEFVGFRVGEFFSFDGAS